MGLDIHIPFPFPIPPIRVPLPFGRGEPKNAPDVTAPSKPPIGFQGTDAARDAHRQGALADYAAIQSTLVLEGGDSLRVRERAGDDAPATAWPHGQVAAAALDRALISGDVTEARKALEGLGRFQRDGSYNPHEGSEAQDRFYDDNAWIGLDFAQGFRLTGDQQYIDKARAVYDFLKEGLHKDGGLYWAEGQDPMSRNAASMGPAMQLAMQLHELTGDQQYLDFAKNLDGAMSKHLRRPDGLVNDSIADNGTVDEHVYSYNQGTAIGSDLQLFRATGDQTYLDRAKRTATASLDHFSADELWKQPPSFNAIYFRNLLQLDAVAPDPRIRESMEQYLRRSWNEARGADGLYQVSSGMSFYEGEKGPGTPAIDQAAFVQMRSLLAMTPEQLRTVA